VPKATLIVTPFENSNDYCPMEFMFDFRTTERMLYS
jgi:hypothetical protein